MVWLTRQPRGFMGVSPEFAPDREAVANGQHAQFDAGIIPELGVEGAQRQGVIGTVSLVGHLSAPEHIVRQDQAPGAQQIETAFVVLVVAGLVCTDECEVKRCRCVRCG